MQKETIERITLFVFLSAFAFRGAVRDGLASRSRVATGHASVVRGPGLRTAPCVGLQTSRRVAAMGEALSHGFCVTLVQTVPQHPLTMPHDLSQPPHGQIRPDRSPKRPDRFSRPPLWRFWRRQRRPRWPGRSGPSTAVSSISRAFRAFRAFNGRLRLLYRPQR